MSDEKTNYEGLEQDDYIELPVPEDDVKEPVKKADDEVASSSDSSDSPESSVSSESSDSAVVSEDKSSSKKEVVKNSSKKTVSKKKAKKKVVKKAAKKTASSVSSSKKPSRRKSRSLDWLWILLIVIGAAIIAVVAFMLLKSGSSDSTADNSSLAVIATVNGEPIYQQDVDSLYDSLPAYYKQQTSKDYWLNQMINQKLLLQEAKNRGIEVSDSEIDAEIDDYFSSFLASLNIDDSKLRSLLDNQGISYEQFIDNLRNQIMIKIMINKLINESVISVVNVSDSEVSDYYETNKESFVVPETVVVRHILLRPKDNESTDELLQRAESVKELIAADFSNFCDLVSNYSEDPGSKDSCGEYAVRQDGTFVKSFEDAAFNMRVNETSVVESPFGVHIIWKVSEQPETQQSLDEVKDQIVEVLKQQKIPVLVKEFVDSLREKADIVFYSPDGSEVPSDSSGSSESSVSSESSASSASSESDSSVEESEVVDSSAEDSSSSSESSDYSSLADCLSDKNAVMYGVSWAPDVQAQKDLLGEEVMSKVKYVDCEASDAPEECSDVTVYPTWVIDGKTLKGKQSLNALASASSCLS